MVKCNEFLLSGIVGLLVVLTACSSIFPPRLKPEDIVGLWVERQVASEAGNASACASFEFFADGRFEAHNIPREYFILLGISPTRIDASGSWEMDTSSKDPFAFHRVNLMFDPVQGFPLGFDSLLFISTDGQEHILFAELGESHRVTFVKRDKVECE